METAARRSDTIAAGGSTRPVSSVLDEHGVGWFVVMVQLMAATADATLRRR
jgi:hypothetical protein